MKNPGRLVITRGVLNLCGLGYADKSEDFMFQPALRHAVYEEYKRLPDVCVDGGNDREFFNVQFREWNLFVARNETGGLTVMLPTEY